MDTYITKIQFRQDSKANWTNVNPILSAGEPGYEVDTNRWKLGDGINKWNTLEYRDQVYNPNLPSTPTEPVDPSTPEVEYDKLTDVDFTQTTLTYSDNVVTIDGNVKYTTEKNLIPIEAPGSINLNIEGSANVNITNNNNSLKIDLSEDFISKFNYLDNQSQIFMEDYDKYTDFTSALNEFITNSGLEILGFKIQILRDLNVAYYNWEFKTDGTVTKELKTFKILDGNSTVVSFNFKYNDDKTSLNILTTDNNNTVLIKVSTDPTNYLKIVPQQLPETSTDGYLNIPALGQDVGIGSIADNETATGINNSIKFSIIGLDKTGVNKKK